MMSLKLFFLGFGLLCCQLTVDASQYTTNPLADMIEEAHTRLLELAAEVQQAISTSESTLEALAFSLAEQIHEVEEQGARDVSDIIDRIKNDVESIKDGATPENEEIVEDCVTRFQDRLNTFPGELDGIVKLCIDGVAEEAEEIVGITLNLVRNSTQVLTRLRADLDICEVLADSRECLANLVIEILFASLETPLTIEEETERAVVVVKALSDNMPGCARARVATAAELAFLLVQQIRICIAINGS